MLDRRFAGFSWAGKVAVATSDRIETAIHRVDRQFIAE
jgi:hypothetical protein